MRKRSILTVLTAVVLACSLCGCKELERVEEKAPTCTENGNVEYWTDGTSFFADPKGNERLESVALPALGHDYVTDEKPAGCIDAGTQLTTCSRCDFNQSQTLPAVGHLFGGYVVIRAAECEAEGLESRVCAVCKQTEDRVLFALGHSVGTDNACTRCDWSIPETQGLSFSALQNQFEVKGCVDWAVEIVIPTYHEGHPVTGIENEAFKDAVDIVSLKAYCSFSRIGQNAFRGCRALKTVEIDGVELLGNNAFYNCTALEEIHLGHTLKEIGSAAFYNCTSLASITLPASLTEIQSGAFHKCESLTLVNFSGTKAEWEKVLKGANWASESMRILCSDGEI